MNTPIADFLEDYQKRGMLRLHMPGHNGEAPHDITEISGADSLYETDTSRGIIAHSEAIAAKLFGALYQAGVNVRMIDQGSSELNIIVGVDTADFDTAMRAIYNAFVV